MANNDYFIHPYNFIPLSGEVQRKPYRPDLAHFSGYSGTINVRLETLTRLFIPDRRKTPHGAEENHDDYMWLEKYIDSQGRGREHTHYAKFLRNANEQYIIPGSSLKGMLRSVAEAISDSCFTRADEERVHEYGDYAHSKCRNPRDEQDDAEGLCMCCRIFGKVGNEGESAEEHSSNFKGRVNISDAVLDTTEKVDRTAYTLKVLGTPKPREGEKYYYDDQGKINGRKFYYHFRSGPEHFSTQRKSNQNCTIHESITEGAVFKFTIKFENLEQDELALLLYAILLDNKPGQKSVSMAHKVGMAKPLGFGSVRLSIDKLAYSVNSNAYSDFSGSMTAIQQLDGNYSEELNKLLTGYPNPFAGSDKLYDIWRFPKTRHPEKVHYPDRSWTQDNKNVGLRLPRSGMFPKNFADKDKEFIDDVERVRKIREKTFEVIVLQPGRFAKCTNEEGEKIEVLCRDRTIRKGDTILVYKTEKGVYIHFQEEG